MTVEDTLAEVIAKVGIWWPAVDECDLHAAADAWDTFAAALDTAAQGGSAAANTVTAANNGPAIDAFEAFWSRYNGSCSGYLPSTATAARNMALACRDYAHAVAEAKQGVRQIAIEIGATLAAGAGFAVLTFGASQAAAASVAATLVARAAAIGVQLSTRAAALTRIAAGVGVSTVEAAAASVALAQPIRVEVFGRGGYSFDEFRESMAYGAMFGPLGGAARSARSSISDALAGGSVAGTVADDFVPPPIRLDRHGDVTNGSYTIHAEKMAPHVSGATAGGKSQFLFKVDTNKLVLDAASYADQFGLWTRSGKAKVYVANGPVGVTGRTGELTSWVNIYRTETGRVHASPGGPPR